jgi:hypothetical protein
MLKEKRINGKSSFKKYAKMGNPKKAANAPPEEYLKIITVPIHIPTRQVPRNGSRPKTEPIAVATPFPPLNARKTEKICPKTTAKLIRRTHGLGAPRL